MAGSGAPDGGAARVVGATVIASVAGSLAVFLVGAQAVQIRHSLHFGTTSFDVAVSLYYLGAGAGSVPAGRLAEAVGGSGSCGRRAWPPGWCWP